MLRKQNEGSVGGGGGCCGVRVLVFLGVWGAEIGVGVGFWSGGGFEGVFCGIFCRKGGDLVK